MSIVFLNIKFYVCGWWGARKFKEKIINYISVRAACMCGICMLGVPTSTSHVHLCITVENVFKVQNSCRELCLYDRGCHIRTLLSCLSGHATPEVCHVQCTEIMIEQSVCSTTSVFLANCWSVHTSRGSANHCLTHRSVLYTKAGASCFVVSY